VVGVDLQRRLELLLGVLDLSAVPEGDPLIENRVGITAAARAGRRAQFRGLCAGGRRLIQLLGEV
jgi:hypothetical protein